jgi:signal peptidase I
MSAPQRRAQPEAAPPAPSATLARRLWDQFGTLLVAVAIALGIRSCVIEPYRIPSESMLPTLLVGDHLFVNKFVYGIKIPFTDLRLPGLREPRHGDVVVFDVARDRYGGIFPVDLRPELPEDRFVKRIVGLPGDTVEVRGGALRINGEPVPVEHSGETVRDEDGRELRLAHETLDGRTHAILDDPQQTGPQRGPITLEAGRYFLMGDNRDHSNDSRIWGTVRLADMKGPAFVLYWSWDWNGSWTQLLNPLTWWELLTERMRWERIGHGIR